MNSQEHALTGIATDTAQPADFVKRCPDRASYLRELKVYKGPVEKEFIPTLLDADDRSLTLRLDNVGRSLRDLLVYDDQKLTVPQLCDVVRGVLGGLRDLHNAGLCHYDVNPANICVNGTFSSVKLVDFGLGFPLTEIPDAFKEQRVGTLSCCSPEHIARKPHLAREADVFSAAVAILEIIEGGGPVLDLCFGAIEPQMKEVRDRVPEKTAWGDPVSAELALLLKAMLHFDPAERPTAEVCYKLALGL